MIEVIKATYPWLLLLLSFLMIVTYVPEVSLFLPTLLMGPETVNM
jgi:C4-dicarboxylate transporter DctM subunit